MYRFSYLLKIAFIFFTLSSLSCATRGELISISSSDGESLLNLLVTKRPKQAQFVGQVKVAGAALGVFPVNVQSDVVMQIPNRVHWAVRSFFGQPTHVLVVDGDHGSWLDMISEGVPVLYTGNPNYFLQTIFGLESLVVKDFIWLWWGQLPDYKWEIQDVLYNVKRRIHVMFLNNEKGQTWQITLDNKRQIQQVKVSWNNESLWALDLEKYRTEGQRAYPTKLIWQVAKEGQAPIRFSLEEGSIQEPLIAEEAFSSPEIPGMEIRPWIQGLQ